MLIKLGEKAGPCPAVAEIKSLHANAVGSVQPLINQ
jgi:hypothetical protein